MLIYKIFRENEWSKLVREGDTAGAPIDLADGFIHFSTAQQAAETAAKHFAGVTGLVLAALNADDLGQDLLWEKSRGDQLFPHLYRRLRKADVLWHENLPLIDGTHRFPERMQ